MNQTQSQTHVRWMIRRDMPEVLHIERQCFDVPWDEEEFVAHLRRKNAIGLVAEHRDVVVGYCVYLMHKCSLEIISMAVDPMRQREGHATAMVRKVASRLRPTTRNYIAATVDEYCLPAQLCLKSLGFLARGIVDGHFHGSGAAYRMRMRLANET